MSQASSLVRQFLMIHILIFVSIRTKQIMPEQKNLSPKLVIYGVGFVGKELVRLATRKDWEIVAAFNRKGEKIGQDIGRLAGLKRDLGVIVQDCDEADYDAINADIVLNASRPSLSENMICYERFLSRGIDVLCHAGEAYHPYWSNPEIAKKIDALAKQNGATFTGSGIWDMTRIWAGMIAAGPCVEIDAIDHHTTTEVLRAGPHWGTAVGLEMTVEEYDNKIGRRSNPIAEALTVPAVTVLQHYGYSITNVVRRREPIVWDEPVFCPIMKKEIPAGVVIGTCFVVDVETSEGVNANTRASYRIFHEGEEEEMGWRVEGLPGMEVRVKREDSGVASASSLFNRIPDVLAAKPGLHTLMEFGPPKPSTLL